MVWLLADYQYGSLDYFGEHGVEVIEQDVGSASTGQGMIGMTRTITATTIQACDWRVRGEPVPVGAERDRVGVRG